MASNVAIQRALISVSDKSGIVEFASELIKRDIEIISTGGTAKLLRENNITVTDVADITGFPELMDGRVKTLHPKIHGALLARPGTDDEALAQHDITPIQLLVVNLYPFQKTIERNDCDLNLAVENIDIGGPTLLRAAAKNHSTVSVVVDSNDYSIILQEMTDNNQSTNLETRFTLAQKVFAHTAQYDAAIANYLGKTTLNNHTQTFPATYSAQFKKQQDLRYGENPHQQAAFYIDTNAPNGCIANAQQLQGKELSYNNIADTDAALECVKSLPDQPGCVIVKHANPCGVALADSQLNAYIRANATDPTSSFGGIIAFNQTLQADTAKAIIDKQFVEVIIAPDVEPDALTLLASKKNVRVLRSGEFNKSIQQIDYKRVTGGLLIQDTDCILYDKNSLKIASKRKPTDTEMQDLIFAWTVAKFVKSNAIVYVKDNATIGIGAGQMSRVDSAKIAARKADDAGLVVKGAVMASDAFFPFRDAIDAAANTGIRAIIQPGGSIRDEEIIQAVNDADIAMVLTGIRHFRH